MKYLFLLVIGLTSVGSVLAQDGQVQVQQNAISALVYLLIALGFAVLYLYYQQSLNRRRKAYYDRIKAQQQILSIAFLATGDEVVDCDLVENAMERLNKSAQLLPVKEIYFQSEAFVEMLHPDDKSTFIGHFDNLLRGPDNNYQLSYRVKHQDSWRWFAERGCVIERDEQGQAIRVVASIRDISEIMQENDQLMRLTKELERRLSQYAMSDK